MERCSSCRCAQPAFRCSCLFPTIPICANCIVSHLGTPGVHTPTPIMKEEVHDPSSGSRKEVCDCCKERSALVFCLCTDPPKKLCPSCEVIHYQKASSMMHFKHPISAYSSIASGEISVEDFTKRQRYVSELELKLTQNLIEVEKIGVKIQSQFDALIQVCVQEKEKALLKLQELQQQLISQINEAAQVIETKRYQLHYEPLNLFEELILTGYLTTPSPNLALFSGSVHLKATRKAVSKSVNCAIETNLFTKKMGSMIPLVNRNKVILVDVSTLEKKEVDIMKINFKINKSTVFCLIDPNTLLYCQDGASIEINLLSLERSKWKEMCYNRSWPGIFKHTTCVFLFGGSSAKKSFKSAEKYILESKTWYPIANFMTEPKHACTACAHSAAIYVIGVDGRGSMSVEMFTIANEQFRLIFNFASGYRHWPLAVIVQEELVIIHYDKVLTWKLGSSETKLSSMEIEVVGNGNYWSNCPAVEHQGEFFTIQNENGSITGLLKFTPKNQLVQIKSFSS